MSIVELSTGIIIGATGWFGVDGFYGGSFGVCGFYGGWFGSDGFYGG